jgi:2'-5' RNA ligase
MSPFPTQMRDRWQNRTEPEPGHGTIYWHMLFHDHPQVRATVKEAQDRLSGFAGLHMTPAKWLHMTALIAGTTDQVSPDQTAAMLFAATQTLSSVRPIPVTLGRVMYHPEAIMLGIRPERALDPILEAVQNATRRATDSVGTINGSLPSWTPHVTVSYSTAEQPAGPIIATLGKELPGCEVVVSAVSLVIQWGPERLWDWEPVGTVQLGTNC